MCRFLLIKSSQPIKPIDRLVSFAQMAERNPGREGGWQGDGWGLSWLDEFGQWQTQRSLEPIWTEIDQLAAVAPARFWLVHARSASFPEHQNNLAYNQPFTNATHAYVFNGFLKGVALPFRLAGQIGAQKIWTLIQRELARRQTDAALAAASATIFQHTRIVQALNVGLCDGQDLYAFSAFAGDPDYYQLRVLDDGACQAICSAPLDGDRWQPVEPGRVIRL